MLHKASIIQESYTGLVDLSHFITDDILAHLNFINNTHGQIWITDSENTL